MRKLVLATHNEHKIRELKELLHGLPYDIKTLNDYSKIPDVTEDGDSYRENAVKKAVISANYSNELALADDSGLEVNALGGRPGVQSSRFAKDDPSRIQKLIQALNTTKTTDRGAQFVCVVAIAEPHGQIWTVQGTCKGMIAPTPLGDQGFGYDPIFFFTELRKTFAQLNSLEKSQYSHRGKAIRNARIILQKICAATASPILSEKDDKQIPRYASIDIGTNCLRLLIAEWDHIHGLTPILRHSEVVRLGQGMSDKMLTPGGMKRVFDQMDKYMEILKKHPVIDIYIGATSAVREAMNQSDFTEKWYERYKLHMTVLRPEQEAQLTYFGALSGIQSEKLFLVDIGGGSTEFIQGKQKKLIKEQSLQLGSVRLTEKYIYHDPVLPNEVELVVTHIKKELDTLDFNNIDESYTFVGSGGTITTITAMNQQMEHYESTKIHNSVITFGEVELLCEELINRTVNQRKELPGLDPRRADVILSGVLICREIMSKYGFNQLIVSERDILDGLILTHISHW